MSQPPASIRTYAFTWLALLALVLLMSLLGFIDMGPFSMVAALIIAAAKAALIAVFFMQALAGPKLVRVIMGAGVIWFLFMMSLTMSDYITRGWLPYPGR